jgi:hypothetical protein
VATNLLESMVTNRNPNIAEANDIANTLMDRRSKNAFPAPAPVPVLFVGGWGRCGSTLLDMLLGQVPGLFSAGEIREIWLRGCAENRPCGCGVAFLDCPFWSKVGEQAYGGWDALDLDDLLATRYSADRPWGVPGLLAPQLRPRLDPALSRYLDALARLYHAIRDVSGASVVIDSSKIPSHALLLRRLDAVDLRVVHLVRDSRGVAYSCQKRVEKRVTTGSPTLLPRYGPLGASVRYALHNGLTVLLGPLGVPYMLLRYEDVLEDPAQRLRDVLAHAGHPANDELTFLDHDQALLASNHMVEGNPVRFASGTLKLRRDEQWRSGLSRADRTAVTILTFPFLTRYGYKV